MLYNETDVTGVILVGGKSRRMGVDKAFLEIEGTPLFVRVLRVFRGTFERTILIGSPAERFACHGLPVYPDIYPGSALGGLYTGLVHAGTPYIFVSACDLPYPSSAVARNLASLRHGFDAVVPKGVDGFEPLFAVYSTGCREPVRHFLENGKLCIFDLYPELNVRYVLAEELTRLDGGERTFVNVNTPEDLARVTRKGII
jgi:molybdenum cofactor guanylyltransferase